MCLRLVVDAFASHFVPVMLWRGDGIGRMVQLEGGFWKKKEKRKQREERRQRRRGRSAAALTKPGIPLSAESMESTLMLPPEARDLKEPPLDLPLCDPVKLLK